MKITLIYDNEVYREGLRADWGFSCLVEVEDQPRILFDTGANGKILLGNMERLDIEPEGIDEIFISHSHWDHTGGLPDFLKINPDVTIYSPSSYRPPKAKKIVNIEKAMQIHENIFSTGELMGIEQSLVVKTERGLVVIDGCSHPGVGNILRAASQFGRVYALIGGLHGFREFALLKDLELVCPCHCTQHISEIKRLYPDKYIEGGAGRVIEL